MYYEINVSDKNGHYFATAPRSITSKRDLQVIYKHFKALFPETAGWKLSVSYCCTSAEYLTEDDINN